MYLIVVIWSDFSLFILRYYRDPPEFQTVIASSEENDNFHIGYYRDDPKDVPVFVASYGGQSTTERNNYKFTLMGDNLFAAIYAYLGQLVNKADPFKMTSLQKLKESVHVHATMKVSYDLSFFKKYVHSFHKISVT